VASCAPRGKRRASENEMHMGEPTSPPSSADAGSAAPVSGEHPLGNKSRSPLVAFVKRLFAIAHAKSLIAVPFYGSVTDVELRSWLEPQSIHRLGRAPSAVTARQADVLVVVGALSHKLAPVLQRAFADLAHPALVVHVTSASEQTKTYALVERLEEVVPVDLVIAGLTPSDAHIKLCVRALDGLVRTRRGA
jgi:NADH-quinone oxidoreductase subunit B